METKIIIEALSALAQETRLSIFRLLVQAGAEGVAAGKLAETLGAPAPTLSFHLQQLRHAGLIKSTRNGTQIIYSANYLVMNDLIAYLTENCCQGKACCPPIEGKAK
ncbi:MAG: ArsR/SmtB family transcription factor [Methylophilaceae bacterium]